MNRFFSHIHPIKQPLLSLSRHLNFAEYRSRRFIFCWKCGHNNSNPVSNCSSCSATQDHLKIQYFELFNMKQDYTIDNKSVILQYHKLQKLFHPDKHSNAPQIEKDHADKMSSLVNNAYKTLINPLERASYILKLNGITCNVTMTDNSAILDEVMKLNEKIQSIRYEVQRKRVLGELTSKIKGTQNNLDLAFKEKNYEEASRLLTNYRYYENLIQKLTQQNRM